MGTDEKTGIDVFIKDRDLGWLPARIIRTEGSKTIVSVAEYNNEADIQMHGKNCTKWTDKTVDLRDYEEYGEALPLQNKTIMEDMVELPILNEAAILYNIKARHQNGLPYTRTGDIVISVNPYQWLNHLYEEDVKMRYANTLVWKQHSQDSRRMVEPHIYETSSLCYKGLALDNRDQSILVSGESGAGKTEAVKICMNHMASLQRGPMKPGGEVFKSAVVQRVVDSNPLLEAFGNAKTRRNDNSSRFGKYVQMQFSRQGPAEGSQVDICKLAGSKCDVYLLEKSRVCKHGRDEGAFHFFYYILNSPDDIKGKIWSGFAEKKCDDFKYVGKLEHERSIDGKSDAENYLETLKALDLIHVKDEKLQEMLTAILIVLLLGNLTFEANPKDDEQSVCTSMDDMNKVIELIGIDKKTLILAFTERTMSAKGEVYKVPLQADLAKEGCDAFAKEIYAKTFLWLVREINAATSAEENYRGGGQTGFGIIGLLDIFGFESFPLNGFEQMCINYCNEKLQQKFTEDIFQSVLEEYKYEGISLNDITYDDNSDVLDLIENRTGLLAMLNEECIRRTGTDGAYVAKAVRHNKKSKALIVDVKMGPTEFGIHHYAGKVNYDAYGFVTLNNDSLPPDLFVVAVKSSNEIIREHLENSATMKSQMVKATKADGTPKRAKSGVVADTVWTKFKSQLTSLMRGLSFTSSRYIRCVKPNKLRKKLLMEHMTTIDQLRCAGVIAAVTISRSSFPNRLLHEECYERFRALKEQGQRRIKKGMKEELVEIVDHALKDFEEDGKKVWMMGKTRIYFRAGALERLENERNKHLSGWAIPIQRLLRGYLVRRTIVFKIQERKAPFATKIQSRVRGILARREYRRLRKRQEKIRRNKRKQAKAATRIQAVARRFLVRPMFKARLGEEREKIRLKKEVKNLEDKVREAEMKRMREVESAREAADTEIEEYKVMVRDEMKNDKEKQNKAAQQQTLIDESGKIIEYLRKENMKLRTQSDAMKRDFKALKDNNARLVEANSSASVTFTALNDHAKQLNVTNAKLIKNVEGYKQKLEKLKDDLKTKQSYYLEEAEARLAYQKTMAQVVGIIQDKCRDPQLVEDIVIMALECEAEAKCERAALDSNTEKAPASVPEPKKSSDFGSDSDDDSDDSD